MTSCEIIKNEKEEKNKYTYKTIKLYSEIIAK